MSCCRSEETRSRVWLVVAIIAAAVAVATTLTLLALRARALRRKTLAAYNDSFDFDYDDYEDTGGELTENE